MIVVATTAIRTTQIDRERVPTGISGLDEILHGGYLAGRTYLISGPPGTGKTTLGWHFLTAGTGAGEPVLYITFGEAEAELRANAERSGFDISGVQFADLSPSSDLFSRVESYDIFSAAEVDREPTTERIVAAMKAAAPRRVFVDSMTHLRYLTTDQFQFRRQSLSFLRYLVDCGATVVVTSEASPDTPDDDLRFISDGVVEIAHGRRARSLAVTKFRGSNFRTGTHTLQLDEAGATLYPRLVPERHHEDFSADALSTGLPAFDQMLGGGIERGTVSLFTGPSGVGKTTLGVQFLREAAARGERSAVYTFDERAFTLRRRCESVNIPVGDMIDRGTLSIIEVEALRFGPDEFANMVRRDVEDNGTRIVMIDSVSGYRVSISGDDLQERLHALCRYLQNVGVTVLLVDELQDISNFRISNIGISYLADNVIFLRYVERRFNGHAEIGRALGVLKKRLSDFDKTLRTFRLIREGIVIEQPLPHLSGILKQVQQGVENSAG
ncbi:MAG: ATPase domain-containing protein [Candidatus Velthaea sp.]